MAARGKVAELAAELDLLEEDIGWDLAESHARLDRLIEALRPSGESELFWRATLLRADAIEREGDGATAARLVGEVRRWAAEHGSQLLISRTHRLLARLATNAGDLGGGLEHMLQCVMALGDDTPPAERILALIKLADAFAATGSMAAARERFEQALAAAAEIGHLERQMTALNNWAYSEYEAGEPQRSWEVLQRLRALARAHDRPLDAAELDTVARVALELGHVEEAERAARDALELYPHDKVEADAQAAYLLTFGMARHRRGDLEGARAALAESAELCERHRLGRLAAGVMTEQAALLASAGRFEDAYRKLCEANEAERRQRDADREEQARNLQAAYEVADARRQAESFRDQARRDSLTGLRNRRFVDEHLRGLLSRGGTGATPVIAALLDLDHFKRINDSLSHQAGDAVLVAFAGLLAQVDAGVDGFAARLGGEEFLLVMTGVAAPEAIMRVADFRRSVLAHRWTSITGDLPVTVSIGVTTAAPDCTVADLLGRADEALYAAKRAGRDRVHLDELADLATGAS
ncbi:Phytochrome-like protein cph2 [Actinoplanes sp. SE50]|uniref:GGDEF domain-containing protein n=1 Tax=unclassified Actinoplanes TaxID=2626549 RepID=UPI00023ECC0E|nr:MULTISPECIES: diguanylate cyclase [unclassified Actinoplanes]AEV81559.1 Phytochrome-like protein cph2 [Actinoplanes sp. SE50/110]ATO79961.1 Phytochrome-like protein cph2 [Actinoplanes sp. SE50]SLL97363.1 Phytochrome-like protein cph2 [Actinoplanes sp. SE50/110]